MNEEHLKDGLNQIAAQNIPDGKDVWSKVQSGLSRVPERAAPTRLIPGWGVAVAAVVMIALVAGLVPSVRARLVDLVETIGGVDFTFSADYPGSGQKVTIAPCEEIPVDEIDRILPFPVPAWAPDGYILEEKAEACYFGEERDQPHITVYWRNATGDGSINLGVHSESGLIVGETIVETLSVNGVEMALWHGGWNYNLEAWDETIPVQTLTWVKDGLTFNLQTGLEVSQDDLLAMAASTFE